MRILRISGNLRIRSENSGYEYRKLKGMDTELLMKVMQETAQRDQKE